MDATRAQADLGLATQRTSGSPVRLDDLVQCTLCGAQQGLALASAFGLQQGIEAGHEMVAGEVGMLDLCQIADIEEGGLQGAMLLGQLADGVAAQAGNRLQTLDGTDFLADTGTGEHATLPDQVDRVETEVVPQLGDGVGEGGGVGGIALEDLDSDGHPGRVSEEPEYDLKGALSAVLGRADVGKIACWRWRRARERSMASWGSYRNVVLGGPDPGLFQDRRVREADAEVGILLDQAGGLLYVAGEEGRDSVDTGGQLVQQSKLGLDVR